MSVTFRISDQILKLDDLSDATEAIVHKYDAFLNLLHTGHYAFLRDAAREALRFLVSAKYPDLERLARENWNRPELAKRHASIDALLGKMPLKERKAATLDIATGGGKSFLMYGLAAIALAEGLVDRVLVLCPSLTIEDGLLEKFNALAGNQDLTAIMKELGAVVAIPGIKRGNETIQPGDICIENIHAVYTNAGSSIADSFMGHGGRKLVLNDEAHHLFSPDDSGESSMKKWLQFLVSPEYGFRYLIKVTGTPYTGNDYFPDVIHRFGLKQAIESKVIKKPDCVLEETHKKQSWDKIYAVHQENVKEYGTKLRPISIVITKDIAECVEQWQSLVAYLVKKEKIKPAEAEKKVIWITSGIPTNKSAKARVEAAYSSRDSKDSPDKRRKENLTAQVLGRGTKQDSRLRLMCSMSAMKPERKFSDLLFEASHLIVAFIKPPDRGCYSFPYSYKPAKTGKTHTVNEFFNPDFFIRLKDSHDVLVVEIKDLTGDNNRNRAKFRDGKEHFKRLNVALDAVGEPWRYHFYFLWPDDYTGFFDRIRDGKFIGWRSGLMVELGKG